MAFPIVLLMCVTTDWSFYLAMITLGVAWNFSFTGGMSLFFPAVLAVIITVVGRRNCAVVVQLLVRGKGRGTGSQ